MGLPGSGKTTLSKELSLILNAVYFNADEIRANINKDLGFSIEDRVEQARRMGWLCDQVAQTKTYVIADFVCPTEETRKIFNADYVIWVDRITKGRFEDTNKIFEPPTKYNVRITTEYALSYWVKSIMADIKTRHGDEKKC